MDRRKISWKVHFWGPFLQTTPRNGRNRRRDINPPSVFQQTGLLINLVLWHSCSCVCTRQVRTPGAVGQLFVFVKERRCKFGVKLVCLPDYTKRPLTAQWSKHRTTRTTPSRDWFIVLYVPFLKTLSVFRLQGFRVSQLRPNNCDRVWTDTTSKSSPTALSNTLVGPSVSVLVTTGGLLSQFTETWVGRPRLFLCYPCVVFRWKQT